jgi:hypothetical protein
MKQLVADVADACAAIDASGATFKSFQPGVGPFGEPQLVKLMAAHLAKDPRYPGAASKRTPDLLIPHQWALEFKIARPFGDNGLEAESWSVNLLHPYAGNVSVFADCLKLMEWSGPERRAAVVVGYEHSPARIDLEPLFLAFEAVAAALLPCRLSERVEERRTLRHPVHQLVRVVAWEVLEAAV